MHMAAHYEYAINVGVALSREEGSHYGVYNVKCPHMYSAWLYTVYRGPCPFQDTHRYVHICISKLSSL